MPKRKYDENRQSTSATRRKPKAKRGGITGFLTEILSMLIWALALAYILRTFLFQPFHIPSTSMEPNLVMGDYIITTKYAYGYGRYSALPLPLPLGERRLLSRAPMRGDVAVFRDNDDGSNVVKRIIGFPGERIQMSAGRLIINDVAVSVEDLGGVTSLDDFGNPIRIDTHREQLESGARYPIYDRVKDDRYDDTQAVIVPEGHYFVLGDNRDSSADSRVDRAAGGTGFVDQADLMGRAEFVLLSVNSDFAVLKPWTWANVNANRFFKDVP